jgi:hypothetical protein
MSVVIRQCTVTDLLAEPNFSELLNKYADELALEGLPRPKAKIEMYKGLEALGKMHFFAAYLGNLLIGIVNVLMSESPHYGISIAVTESYFVFQEYRKTGAGMLLRREAETDAKKSGSPGIFISAPTSGSLALSLEASKDYMDTGRTFFKRLA